MRYAMLRYDGQRGGLPRPHGQIPPARRRRPLIYLSLGDRLQEAEQLVPRLGGRVLEPLHSIGSGHGSRVIIRRYRRELAGPLCPTSRLTGGQK